MYTILYTYTQCIGYAVLYNVYLMYINNIYGTMYRGLLDKTFIVHCTMNHLYSIHCSLYNVYLYCIVYSEQFPLYTFQCMQN